MNREGKKCFLYSRVSTEMQVEGGFRKFMFWATPILLFAQSIAMALLLLR